MITDTLRYEVGKGLKDIALAKRPPLHSLYSVLWCLSIGMFCMCNIVLAYLPTIEFHRGAYLSPGVVTSP